MNIDEIVDRLKGAGLGVNTRKLLEWYISTPDDVPEPLVHQELVKYKQLIINRLNHNSSLH